MPQLFFPLRLILRPLAQIARGAKGLQIGSLGGSSSTERHDVVNGRIFHCASASGAKAALVLENLRKVGLGLLHCLLPARHAFAAYPEPRFSVLGNPLAMPISPLRGVGSISGLASKSLAFRAVVAAYQSLREVTVFAGNAREVVFFASSESGCAFRMSNGSHVGHKARVVLKTQHHRAQGGQNDYRS